MKDGTHFNNYQYINWFAEIYEREIAIVFKNIFYLILLLLGFLKINNYKHFIYILRIHNNLSATIPLFVRGLVLCSHKLLLLWFKNIENVTFTNSTTITL